MSTKSPIDFLLVSLPFSLSVFAAGILSGKRKKEIGELESQVNNSSERNGCQGESIRGNRSANRKRKEKQTLEETSNQQSERNSGRRN